MSLLQAVLSDPAQTVITYPPEMIDVHDGSVPPKPNVFRSLRKHWRQLLNIIPGLLLLWIAGVQILWAIREIVIERKHQDEELGDHLIVPEPNLSNFTFNATLRLAQDVEPYVSNGQAFFFTISTWYVGIAVGSAIGAILYKVLTVKVIYSICAVLLFIAAVLNLTTSQIVIQTLVFTEILLAGLIYGINHVTVICHAADTCAREIRGTVVRVIAYYKWLVILLASCAFYISYPTYDTFVRIALVYIVVALIVLLLVFCIVSNSFVQSLESHGEHEETIRNRLARIRGEADETRRAQQALDELKLQLSEDQADGTNILANGNVRPLILVGAARLLSVLINNVPVLVISNSWVALFIVELGDPAHNYNAVSAVLTVNLAAKFVLGVIGICVADCISLNRFYYVIAIVWSIFVVVLNLQPYFHFLLVVLPLYWIVGVGVDAISLNQLSEAFPLTKRPASIATIHIFEALVEIILLGIYLLAFPQSFFIPIVIGVIVCCIVLLKWLPNTHGHSLRDARDLFNNSIVHNVNQKYELTRLNENGSE